MTEEVLGQVQEVYVDIARGMVKRQVHLAEAKAQGFLQFDLEGFMFRAVEDPSKIQESTFIYEDDTTVTYRFSEHVSTNLIKLNPSKDRIISNLLDLFNDTLDSIQVIRKWSKND